MPGKESFIVTLAADNITKVGSFSYHFGVCP
jgi:hypothetical protein